MRNRIAVWGRNAQEQRVLITIELQTADNIVRIETYPEKVVSDEVYKAFMDKWRKRQEAPELPEPDRVIARELSVTEGLLPDDLKAEQTDMILRAQTEWHFHVLSEKLAQTYRSEIAEIEDRIERAEQYSSDLWNQAKNFWQKVQGQVQDKTIMREHGNELRKRSDAIFSKLKEMRAAVNEQYKEESEKQVAKFTGLLEEAETRIGQGTHLNKVFQDLKGIQKKFNGAKFTKDDRDRIYNRIDAAFKAVKQKRGIGGDSKAAGAVGRTENRLNGLLRAMDRMRSGIGRDENDLKFERRRIERTNGQLEAQIRQAKIVMIESRIASKQTKLDDMEKTKAELEKRMEKEKARAEKQAKKAAERAAADAAKAKIAAEIASREVSPEEAAKLEAAAALIAQNNPQKLGKRKKVKPLKEDKEIRKAAPTDTVANMVAFSQVTSTAPTPTPSESAPAPAAAPAAELPVPAPEPTLGEQAVETVDKVATQVEDAAAELLAKGGPVEKAESFLEEIVDQVQDAAQDVVDTVKAVVQVAQDKFEEE